MSNGRLYDGDEHLKLNGKELPYNIVQYWRLNLSELLLSITRGGFAEFIVLCALNSTGFDCMNQVKSGVEPWDIDGPQIEFPNERPRPSRIEVKCTASVQLDTPDEKEPISNPITQLKFDIRKKKNQSLPDWQIPRRNNDLYVFAHYAATRKSDDILDMNFWKFYVYPTFRIEDSPVISKLNYMSIWRLQNLGVEQQTFETLSDAIYKTVSEIERHFRNHVEKS